jgi:hypothetical protein
MERRARTGRAPVVMVSACAALLAWSCDAGTYVADAMVDAGGTLRDASVVMMDASVSIRDAASDAAHDASGGLRDASETMIDASEGVRDSAASDADAQVAMPLDVACDVERTWRVEGGSVWTEQTLWYAEVRDPSIDPDSISRVDVRRCDRVYFGDPAASRACPAGATCTGVYSVAPDTRCAFASVADVEEGLVRVNCGNRYQTGRIDGSITPSDSGFRFASVRITIER